MTYLAVKDLKKTKELWQMLAAEKELVITRDGKPSAIMVSISPETAEESLSEIRRALFSMAISHARAKAEEIPLKPQDIENAIRQSRTDRGIS